MSNYVKTTVIYTSVTSHFLFPFIRIVTVHGETSVPYTFSAGHTVVFHFFRILVKHLLELF